MSMLAASLKSESTSLFAQCDDFFSLARAGTILRNGLIFFMNVTSSESLLRSPYLQQTIRVHMLLSYFISLKQR